MNDSIDISIIVPTFNEEQNIEHTIQALQTFLQSAPFSAEVIIVCDGCTDQTPNIAKKHENGSMKTLDYAQNMGKGGAIKRGFQKAKGKYIVFFDAGLDFTPEEITKFYNTIVTSKADGIIGSKRHKKSSIHYPFKRKVISKTGQVIVKTLFHIPYSDTQVGIKLFKREVLEAVLPKIVILQYAFDIELLVLCYKYGFRIIEAPVTLNFNNGTSSVNWKTIFHAFTDTLRIFKYLHRGRYKIPHQKNHPNN